MTKRHDKEERNKRKENIHNSLVKQAYYRVLRFLIEMPAFNYKTYQHKGHALFQAPPPVRELPVGPQYVTCQYMLNTVHIEEASYEGNDTVLADWWRQLGLDSPEKQKWIGEEELLVSQEEMRGVDHYLAFRTRARDLHPLYQTSPDVLQ
jgi:hypothetical protein